ncbi:MULTISPECIES: MarR family winged helix-turn-helix transcriptional regulator [unclassified Undibacterium]|uniref:MarR family winged helix-turn-helix transcriptional regulator n=1 Tax=unclassified Undibacterium TaxID=2630295 RepID=UPI0034DD559D
MKSSATADRDLWRSFRQTYEKINFVIERELVHLTQLSGADHGILSRLAESPGASCRQQDLANSMRWDRTRLSHHLHRMEERGLVEREKVTSAGTIVKITNYGDVLRLEADPIHAAIVAKHFTSKLSAVQREAFSRLSTIVDNAEQCP